MLKSLNDSWGTLLKFRFDGVDPLQSIVPVYLTSQESDVIFWYIKVFLTSYVNYSTNKVTIKRRKSPEDIFQMNFHEDIFFFYYKEVKQLRTVNKS